MKRRDEEDVWLGFGIILALIVIVVYVAVKITLRYSCPMLGIRESGTEVDKTSFGK